MRVLTGTSGYAFKEWKGEFYPKDLPDGEMLRFYAGRFPAVEINNTFYRMPKEQVLLDWSSQVPDDFCFALKASQRITHHHRLKEVEDLMEYFLRVSSALGEKRGPTLFQLPPNMRKDLPRLVDFLELIPKRWRAAIEFRHASWFEDDVYEALKAKDAALCIAEQDDLATPLVATAGWGYLRLHRAAYDQAALGGWVERIRGQPWEDAFVFFKHEGDRSGPPVAVEFAQACAR